MRFFISVNKEERFTPNRYYRKNLEVSTEIPLYDMLKNGRVCGTESYKLITPCTDLMLSPVAKKIEEAVCKSHVSENLFFVESNSAHNMTYFTASIATASLEEGKKILIVNFDQHADHGTATGELLCSNWGGFAGKDLHCDYLVIGEASSYRKKKCQLYSDGKLSIKNLEEIAYILNIYDAFYITVDMDVLKSGDKMPKRTNWDEGILTKEALMSYLNLLPDGKIISADITGFPPFETAKLETVEGHLTQYITDINEIAEKLESKF